MIYRLRNVEVCVAIAVMLGSGCDSSSSRSRLDEQRSADQGVQASSEVSADSFRLAFETREDGFNAVFDIGAPEGKLMGLNIGELKDQSPDYPFREHPGVSLKRFSISVTAEMLPAETAETSRLELFFKFSPADSGITAWWRPKFEVDKGKDISEILSVNAESGLYKIGEPVGLCSVVGVDGKIDTVFMHIFDAPEEATDGQAN